MRWWVWTIVALLGFVAALVLPWTWAAALGVLGALFALFAAAFVLLGERADAQAQDTALSAQPPRTYRK